MSTNVIKTWGARGLYPQPKTFPKWHSLHGYVEWNGVILKINDKVFPPWYSSQACIQALEIELSESNIGGKAIDIGCGSGIIGLYLALKASCEVIFFCDIDSIAVKSTQENAYIFMKINRDVYSKMLICQSDFLSAFSESMLFDLIIANPPLDPNSPNYEAVKKWGRLIDALYDPDHASLKRLFSEAAMRLAPSGRFYLSYSPKFISISQLVSKAIENRLTVLKSYIWDYHTPYSSNPLAVTQYGCAVIIHGK